MTETLAKKMYALADLGTERGPELRARAEELENAAADLECPPKRLLGAWARARRLWCECTGEPLV